MGKRSAVVSGYRDGGNAFKIRGTAIGTLKTALILSLLQHLEYEKPIVGGHCIEDLAAIAIFDQR